MIQKGLRFLAAVTEDAAADAVLGWALAAAAVGAVVKFASWCTCSKVMIAQVA